MLIISFSSTIPDFLVILSPKFYFPNTKIIKIPKEKIISKWDISIFI